MYVFLLFLYLITPSLENVTVSLTISDEGNIIEVVERDAYSLPFHTGLFFNHAKLQRLLNQIDEATYKRPIDATIADDNSIINEQLGSRMDRVALTEAILRFFYSGVSNQIEVPKEIVHPKVDRELLLKIRDKKMGEYETYFKKANVERTHNIELSTKAINNYVVLPGEQFSFNKVVGERTKERGYKKAPVIVKGEIEEDIGGGICQVSSTLFNAVNLKGIEIIERYSHSRSVPYVPPGKDATVSWWGPDFVFKNKYDQPILIRAQAIEGRMIIRIYSSSEAKPTN
ncbi:VanW family protein [Virgibacillus sp. W0430]|uniref:VanW family protein n=1 Tax=Virgibacillus sp. W0430 TaxID=3391580 RepID=UPI003F4887E1